jgi:hypothetical protein
MSVFLLDGGNALLLRRDRRSGYVLTMVHGDPDIIISVRFRAPRLRDVETMVHPRREHGIWWTGKRPAKKEGTRDG